MDNRSGDGFDGGELLDVFGVRGEPPAKQPRDPSAGPRAPRDARRAAAPEREVAPPTQDAPAPKREDAGSRQQARNRHSGLDFRSLSSSDLVRSMVLSEVLGPPLGRRGRRRR